MAIGQAGDIAFHIASLGQCFFFCKKKSVSPTSPGPLWFYGCRNHLQRHSPEDILGWLRILKSGMQLHLPLLIIQMTLWHKIFCFLFFFWIMVHFLVLVATGTEMKKKRKSQTTRSWKGLWQIIWPSHLQLHLSEFTCSRNNHEYPAKFMLLTMLRSAGHT